MKPHGAVSAHAMGIITYQSCDYTWRCDAPAHVHGLNDSTWDVEGAVVCNERFFTYLGTYDDPSFRSDAVPRLQITYHHLGSASFGEY
jgi:hypothetical protein